MSDEAYEAFMEANYDSGRSLPEGLHLTITPTQDSMGIFDAQDVMWVEFTDGGNGDPAEWAKTIIRKTCEALGVAVGIDEMGEVLDSVDEAIDQFFGDIDFLD